MEENPEGDDARHEHNKEVHEQDTPVWQRVSPKIPVYCFSKWIHTIFLNWLQRYIIICNPTNFYRRT